MFSSEVNLLWTVFIGTLVFVALGGSLVLLIVFNQRRSIRYQQKMLAELSMREEALKSEVKERKRAQEIARDLSNKVIEVQEEERRRVSRELHDGIIQLLSSIQLRLGLTDGTRPSRKSFQPEEIKKVSALMERAVDEVRRISHDLRPSVLDDLGLVSALRSLCEEFSEKTRIPVDLHLPDPPGRLPKRAELALFRICQEAFNNVEKHSRARQVSLLIKQQDSDVLAVVHDDGRGFGPDSLKGRGSSRSGLGLAGMRERALAIGGTVSIESTPKAGTTIEVRIPLESSRRNGRPK